MESDFRPSRSLLHPFIFGLLFGSALIFGLGISYVAWVGIPYEKLERFSPEEQFVVWEGVVWLVALLLTFLGLSIIFERAGWRLRSALRDLRQQFGPDLSSVLMRPEVVPWWMLTAGGVLMAIGSVARAILAP